MQMIQAASVFFGAGAGAVLRWRIGAWAAAAWPSFPAGTLLVNLIGSLAIGVAAGLFESRTHIPQEVRLLLVTGFLGGFTTFSAFSLEMVEMLPVRTGTALALAVGKIAACVALAYLGLAAARRI